MKYSREKNHACMRTAGLSKSILAGFLVYTGRRLEINAGWHAVIPTGTCKLSSGKERKTRLNWTGMCEFNDCINNAAADSRQENQQCMMVIQVNLMSWMVWYDRCSSTEKTFMWQRWRNDEETQANTLPSAVIWSSGRSSDK